MNTPAQTTNANDLSNCLAPGRYVDSDHPAVISFARRVAGAATTPHDIALKLYYAVRDEFLYDPYHFDTSIDGLKASHVIASGRGFCVPKAALLAAASFVTLTFAGVPPIWAGVAGAVAGFGLRAGAIHYGWALPAFGDPRGKGKA